MIPSLLRSFLIDGGLPVETRKDGLDSPILIRTTVQLDGHWTTFVDFKEGGISPDMIVRHSDSIRKAYSPLVNLLKSIDRVVLGALASLFFVLGLASNGGDVRHKLLVGAVTSAIPLITRLLFPRLFRPLIAKLAAWVVDRSIRQLSSNSPTDS